MQQVNKGYLSSVSRRRQNTLSLLPAHFYRADDAPAAMYYKERQTIRALWGGGKFEICQFIQREFSGNILLSKNQKSHNLSVNSRPPPSLAFFPPSFLQHCFAPSEIMGQPTSPTVKKGDGEGSCVHDRHIYPGYAAAAATAALCFSGLEYSPGSQSKLRDKHYSKEYEMKRNNTEQSMPLEMKIKIILWIPHLPTPAAGNEDEFLSR